MQYKALNFEEKLGLIEPRGVVNTGNEGGDLTAANDVWI